VVVVVFPENVNGDDTFAEGRSIQYDGFTLQDAMGTPGTVKSIL
jgi:hypothetical protein